MTKVCMTVAEVGVTVTTAEVGVTVTEGLSIIRVLLFPKDELSRTDKELSTWALELGETVAIVLNTAVEFFNIKLDLMIPLVLTVVIKLVDITVLFPVNIAVVSREVDFRAVLVSVGIKLLVFIKRLLSSVTVLENVTLVFESATKLLALGSKVVEERKLDLLLGRRNEVLVTLLLTLGTPGEEFAKNTVDETVCVETITCVVFDEILV